MSGIDSLTIFSSSWLYDEYIVAGRFTSGAGESFGGQYEIVCSLGECGSWGGSRGALQNGFGLIQVPFWQSSISQE